MSDWNKKIIEEFRANEGPGFEEYRQKTSRVIPVITLKRKE